VIKPGQLMLSKTNPADSKTGTIKGDFYIQFVNNSEKKMLRKKITVWFKPEEPIDYKSCAHDWDYE
jgi:nucleoside-diphosphate kinase